MLFRIASRTNPSTHVGIVLALAGCCLAATCIAQFLTGTPAWRFDSPVEFNSDFAVGVGFAWTLYQLAVHRRQRHLRISWLIASGAMLLLAAVQVTDWLVDVGMIGDDWLVDMPLWLVAAAMIHAVLGRARKRPWVMHLWHLGFFFQIVFVVCDLSNGRVVAHWLGSVELVSSLTEWTEMLAIDCYVLSLALFSIVPVSRLPRREGPDPAVGAEARRIYRNGYLYGSARYPPVAVAFCPGLRQLIVLATCLWLVATLGPLVRRSSKRSLAHQFGDLLALACKDAFDPLSYYFQQLYGPKGRAEAAYYLTRDETKNGLLSALNHLRPWPEGVHGVMKDKLLFAQSCRQKGLQAPVTLLSCDGEGVSWSVPRSELDLDLFCKQRRGRGARGVQVFRWLAHEQYRAPGGETIDLDSLVERLRVRGRRTPLIVQPHLGNHAEIADLADQSLLAIRVLTCLDAWGLPVATHGMLRILAKLEPAWKRNDEYGAPIDLATGRLGPMTSDRLYSGEARHAHHPVTGQLVEGRVLSEWPALLALAVAAHAAFAHLTLIGWDLASTPDGPVLLEGNTNLDVMFPQRVHRQGFGRGPLGPLLEHHLARLAEATGLD